MKFNLGKSLSVDDKPLEAETIKRWRSKGRVNSEEKQLDFLDSEEGQTEESASVEETIETIEPLETARNEESLEAANIAYSPLSEEIEMSKVAIVEEPAFSHTSTPAANHNIPMEEDLSRRFGTNLKAVLGTGTVINGALSFDSPVRIDGTLNGEVTASSALIVGEQGSVEADMKVGTLVVIGRVSGSVEAEDLVEIKPGGCLDGTVTTKRIVIEEGGVFDGDCRMK